MGRGSPIENRRYSRLEVCAAGRSVPACVLFILASAFLLTAQAGAAKRVPWTTSRITGSPEPPPPYLIERVFPNLKFNNPVEMVRAPGSDRLFVMELEGKVFSFPNRADVAQPDLFIDLKAHAPDMNDAYGMAFHPGFATNRFVYLCYVMKPKLADGSRVSRFKVLDTDPPRIDPASERIIITWLSGGHNGGSLHFGPDGCLYLSTGDAESPSPPDPLDTGQDISDLMASVLRIDVDREENGRAYRVPPDNPFVNTPGARPEVWAYGFRNPWKMAFDPVTGALWAGDVGWELWEMVFRVERGGNYGWSAMEGPQPVKPAGKHGPTPISPPIAAHTHVEARSLTGGYVYRGKRLPELAGQYLYGDWVTGKIWALPATATTPVNPREIANTPLQIICFGQDNANELYIVGYDGTVHRLVRGEAAQAAAAFPRKLSQTGLFASVKDHRPAPGVLPYRVNTEPWMDHATAERFIALPGASQLDVQTREDRMQGQVKGAWRFPADAVLAKTISLELERGNPATKKRLETQVLHFDGRVWNAYNYLWNDEQTDAALAGPESTDRIYTIQDAQAPGGRRRQKWHFASRTECLLCHMPWAGYVLGFNPWQLDRDVAASGEPANQLRAFEELGLFLQPVQKPKLPAPSQPERAALEQKARAYLQVNCAHCHQFGGGGTATMDVRLELPLDKTGLMDAKPSQGDFGIADARIVAPGDPCRSVLLYRMAKTGPGRMPHFASSQADDEGIRLVSDWIAAMRTGERNAGFQTGAPHQPATTSEALALALDLSRQDVETRVRTASRIHSQGGGPAIRDLFERFLPDDQRVEKLGTGFKPETILALKGDAKRGEQIFFAEGGAQCASCHRIRGRGREVGPDLSAIGKKLDRAKLLESLVEPSKTIEPAFAAYTVALKNGDSQTGLLLHRDAGRVVLKDLSGQTLEFTTAQVRKVQPQELSLMPEGLLAGLTAQEAADLVEYLAALRGP